MNNPLIRGTSEGNGNEPSATVPMTSSPYTAKYPNATQFILALKSQREAGCA